VFCKLQKITFPAKLVNAIHKLIPGAPLFLGSRPETIKLGLVRKWLLRRLFFLFFLTAMVTYSATAQPGRQVTVFIQLEIDDG
jgi:hypothetical protein